MFQDELATAQEKLKKEVELVMKKVKELTNSVEVPTFEGRTDPEKFLKWLAKVEHIFTIKDVPEDKMIKRLIEIHPKIRDPPCFIDDYARFTDHGL
ncbi:unnamed protein product [Cuscuta campestris]|uniref:Uncharacterized protein n=1 Tax=Cuscuta campestris TaxID=132261 RepID=A0A484LVC8_9ASTE|nr:unnamed protein product [Cuscuta campestris]